MVGRDYRFEISKSVPKCMKPFVLKLRPFYESYVGWYYSLKITRMIPRFWFKIRHGNTRRYALFTDHPIAFESPDHKFPYGTANDNSRNKAFNRSFYRIAKEFGYARPYEILDLGCAGGGLVRTFISDGHNALGLEGSDYCKKRGKFEWGVIPNNLFTCDVTKPFTIKAAGQYACFDMITAWEHLEHIHQRDLPQLLDNIKNHLCGIFVCSISHISDVHGGFELHQTVKPIEWWDKLFAKHGFTKRDDILEKFNGNFVRAEPNSSFRVFEYYPKVGKK